MKVLIIDDDMDIRALLRELLQINGYTVSEAENGDIGLLRFAEFRPDLVMTDIVMPDREGISTIMELKKKKADVRIIAMSGGKTNSPQYLEWARKLGADRVFAKPLDLESVLLAINELLGSGQDRR